MVRSDLEILVENKLSQREIAEKLGVGQTTVRYWLNKYGLKTNKVVPIVWDEQKFKDLCASEGSLHAVLVKMGVSTASSNYRFAYRLAEKLGIDVPKYIAGKMKTHTYSIDEIFSAGVKRNNQFLRRLMVNELSIPDECDECGQGTIWNGKSLTLQIDHIDGDNLNNTLGNLRIMCPNCHTQTPTFCRSRKT